MRSILWKAAGLGGVGALAMSACTPTATIVGVDGGGGASNGSTGAGGMPIVTPHVDKVDVLLAIDNSRSMADKQQMLSLAVADLVHALENPPCIDQQGNLIAQPQTAFDQCPPGADRPYNPVLDIHIGVISSSLGGHGADACPATSSTLCPMGQTTSNDDRGHLLARQDPCATQEVPTYQSQRFLAWDPALTMTPPGESDPQVLVSTLQQMVVGVGQIGCGYESQLESIYRFLADPAPYDSIAIHDNAATPSGVDEILLDQRANFLRPDSALAIIMVTDENDCSIIDGGQNFYVAQQKTGDGSEFHLPRPRAACAADPNDPCCVSCAQTPPDGCPSPDPACEPSGSMLSKDEDNINLRCLEQKRRFGIDFLHPTSRYVEALTSGTLTDADGNTAPNPIFAGGLRDPGLVFMAGIVGVPWQDVARDPGDLTQGYKTGPELAGVWPVIVGQPDQYVPPTDPFMIESLAPRGGQNPITGESPSSPNSINGHEWTISKNDDLEYACIWTLPASRDCTDPGNIQAGCDCTIEGNDNPLCEGPSNQTQVRAKAYPALRQLKVLQGIGDQGVVASICATNVDDPTRADYAYRPAMSALVDRIKPRLTGF